METSTQAGARDTRSLVQRQRSSSVGHWTSSSQGSRRTAGQPCRSTTTHDHKHVVWSLDNTSVCRSRPGLSRTSPLAQRRRPSSVGYRISSLEDSRRTAGQPCRSTTTHDCKHVVWSLDNTSVCRSRPRLSWTSDYVKSQYKHGRQRRRLDL